MAANDGTLWRHPGRRASLSPFPSSIIVLTDLELCAPMNGRTPIRTPRRGVEKLSLALKRTAAALAHFAAIFGLLFRAGACWHASDIRVTHALDGPSYVTRSVRNRQPSAPLWRWRVTLARAETNPLPGTSHPRPRTVKVLAANAPHGSDLLPKLEELTCRR